MKSTPDLSEIHRVLRAVLPEHKPISEAPTCIPDLPVHEEARWIAEERARRYKACDWSGNIALIQNPLVWVTKPAANGTTTRVRPAPIYKYTWKQAQEAALFPGSYHGKEPQFETPVEPPDKRRPIEIIMDRFGGKWWEAAIKERLGITSYSEMLDPKNKHLVTKYRELVDECLELALTPEAKSPTPPINNQESFVF